MVMMSPVTKTPGMDWYAAAASTISRRSPKTSRASPAHAADPIADASTAGSRTAHSAFPNSDVAAQIAHATPGPLE